jgi:hypothetical protein
MRVPVNGDGDPRRARTATRAAPKGQLDPPWGAVLQAPEAGRPGGEAGRARNRPRPRVILDDGYPQPDGENETGEVWMGKDENDSREGH